MRVERTTKDENFYPFCPLPSALEPYFQASRPCAKAHNEKMKILIPSAICRLPWSLIFKLAAHVLKLTTKK